MGQFTPIVHDRFYHRDDLVFFDGHLVQSGHGREWDPSADEFQKNSEGGPKQNGANRGAPFATRVPSIPVGARKGLLVLRGKR